jgi:hypothetical protein
MTPGDIRALYLETLARFDYESRPSDFFNSIDWDDMTAEQKVPFFANVEPFADALAAEGLLPVAEEWRGGSTDSPVTVSPGDGAEELARRISGPDLPVSRRYLTEWKEAEE